MPTRRRFLASSAAAALAGFGGNWSLAADRDTGDWSFPLLGDLHFDKLDHHDQQWLAREHPNDVRQVENYSRITRDMTPRLLKNVRATCTGLQQAGTPNPFILQLGDLLEGLCGSEDLAERQVHEAVEFLRQAELPVPLLLTKGNHDINGPGAAHSYEQVLLPFMAQATKSDVPRAAFSRTVGGTLLAFYDAYDRASLDWFARLLEETRPKRLIVAIHPPVVPYNARSTWHIYSSPKQQQQRARLLELLGRHKAIVLCGHLHKYSCLVRRTEGGRFVQLAISSVASSKDGRPKDVLDGVKDYGPDLVDLEPRHSPDTVEVRRANLAAERPFIEHFAYADSWGHATVHLRGERTEVDLYQGFDERPSKSYSLSDALRS